MKNNTEIWCGMPVPNPISALFLCTIPKT